MMLRDVAARVSAVSTHEVYRHFLSRSAVNGQQVVELRELNSAQPADDQPHKHANLSAREALRVGLTVLFVFAVLGLALEWSLIVYRFGFTALVQSLKWVSGALF